MPKGLTITLAALAASSALVFLLAAGPDSEGPQQVVVTNFPETQRVNGAVAVEGVVHQAALASILEIEVPPVAPTDLRRLVEGGVVRTDGFGAVVLFYTFRTRAGLRMRATVQNRVMSSAVGINTKVVDRLTFAIGCGSCAGSAPPSAASS